MATAKRVAQVHGKAQLLDALEETGRRMRGLGQLLWMFGPDQDAPAEDLRLHLLGHVAQDLGLEVEDVAGKMTARKAE
jgi:hypothetical protein